MRALLATTLVLIPAFAFAQPAPPPSPGSDELPLDPNKGDAKELMQTGVKLVKSGDYLSALAVFKDAYKRFPSAKILLNIGTTEKLLKRDADAANAYQRYLDSTDADPAKAAEVQKEVERLDATLAKLAISAPAEAEISVGADGEWIPASAAKVYRINPGTFVVHARRDKYKPFEVKGEITVSQTANVSIVLEPNPLPTTRDIIVTVPREATQEEPRSRFAALAMGHFDVSGGGAAFVGASMDVTERIAASASGILGSNFGGYVNGSFAFLTGTLRPLVSAGVITFFNDGARVGVRGAGGLEIVANRHFAVLIELGVEHNFNPQDRVEFGGMLRTIQSTSFIPALGVTARL